jgi:ketosteroid isomerase-like protein
VSASKSTAEVADQGQLAANKDVVRRLFQAFTERRFDAAAELMTADATWWMLSLRKQIPVQAWLSGFQSQTAALFPDGLRFALIDFTSEGDRVAVQARCLGTTNAGATFDNEYHFLFEFAGDRIRAAWEYGDTLHAKQIFAG